MKIEMWLDYLSPMCYKVHQNLMDIIRQDPSLKDVEVLYRSYEMIPNHNEEDMPLSAYIAIHHLMTEKEVNTYCKDINVDVSHLRATNVRHAHQLSHLAKRKGLASALNERLFKAFFDEHLDIQKQEVLIELGLEIGLNEADMNEVFSSDKYLEAIELNRENAILKGIHEIPHVRIDGKYKLDGYFTKEAFKHMVLKSKNESNYKAEHCEGEHCQRKKTR